MIRPLTTISTVFLAWLFLLQTNVYGQVSVDSLRNYFNQRITRVYQEKVHLYTDRSFYVTGETIWMSAWCVDAMLHTPSGISRVLNIELIDAEGVPVRQTRWRMEHGHAAGQLFVGPDLTSGYYQVRAYTNWMRNFDPELFHSSRIGIINPAETPPANDQQPLKDSLMVEFFPEGGRLVEGLKSRVAVRVTDQHGQVAPTSGIVYDSNDREVASFNTSSTGLDAFEFVPASGKSYVAKILMDSSLQSFELPTPEPSGFVISISNQEDVLISLSSSGTSGDHFLVAHSRGKVGLIEKVPLTNEWDFTIPGTDLLPGISEILVLDPSMKPVVRRSIFRKAKAATEVVLEQPSATYGTREKVSLPVKNNASDGQVQFSVSVYRTDDAINHSGHIQDGLLSNSLLKKFEDQRLVDLKLLTIYRNSNNWNLFNNQDFSYPAEINGPVLSGQLKGENEIRNLVIDFIGKPSVMNSADLDSEGRFHFEVPYRVKNDRVHFFNLYEQVEAKDIVIENPFTVVDLPTPTPASFPPTHRPYFEKLNTNIQLSQVYREFNYINGLLNTKQAIENNFYGTPDHAYQLDEYTRFNTVRDLFIEYIRWAVIKNNNTRSDGFYVANDDLLTERALTAIDGVPVMDVSTMLNFDPLKIERIELVDDYYYVGSTRFPGVVNFSTYDGDFDQQELPGFMVEKPYYPIQQVRQFYSPQYSHADSLANIPDYRSTLYWNPMISVAKDEAFEVEFFTGDDSGTYTVEINGVTDNGAPVYITRQFKVMR